MYSVKQYHKALRVCEETKSAQRQQQFWDIHGTDRLYWNRYLLRDGIHFEATAQTIT